MKYILFALTAAFLLTIPLSCSKTDDNTEEIIEIEETEEISERNEIIIGTTGMTGVFSPFFTDYLKNAGDADVMSVINVPLVTLDRRGEVVQNAVSGEKRTFDGVEYEYKGIADIEISTNRNSTVFNFNLREDVYFSDGKPLTADDLIFTLYALCDADYDGDYGLGRLPVTGLDYYRTNADSTVYRKYAEIAALCFELYRDEEFEPEIENDDFTEELYELFSECYREAWISHVKAIVSYSVKNYGEYAALISTGGDIESDEWMKTALAMMIWRTADFIEIAPASEDLDAIYGPFTSFISGREWNLVNEFPTIEDFFEEFYEFYEGDIEAYINAERISEYDNPVQEITRLFIEKCAAADADNTGSATISGISRIGDYEVEVSINGNMPSAVYSFVFPVAPLHYYGNTELYDYDNGIYGFIRGDLSGIRSKSAAGMTPLGAGAYKLIEFDGFNAALSANENYYKGVPATARISFRETDPYDLIYGAASGMLDIAAVYAAREVLDEIDSYNAGNSSNTGIIMQEALYDTFGYIGMNADRMGFGQETEEDDEDQSNASVLFRKGFAVIFAAYRDISIRDFYGEAAKVAEYPVSGVSWTAPRAGDVGYRQAYSVKTNGGNIYSPEMTETRRLEAAKQAALVYFEAAGCVLNEAGTAIEEFPEELDRSYDIYITGGGTGRHPSYLLLTMAADALKSIGITLEIKDVDSQGNMYRAVRSGEADMWCAAWNSSVLPYLDRNFSTGGEDNFFGLKDEDVDQRIAVADASLSLDLYKNSLDAVLDRAVIVPVYQREIYFIFGKTLDENSIEQGLTTHYNYTDVLWKIKID
ncbi:MAG: ABC transporter substrate-binding protein [Oscillospiraceae bacterium]|nr:ABC transporter substrate-binding protein [Oscillospiraceae bacterium]